MNYTSKNVYSFNPRLNSNSQKVVATTFLFERRKKGVCNLIQLILFSVQIIFFQSYILNYFSNYIIYLIFLSYQIFLWWWMMINKYIFFCLSEKCFKPMKKMLFLINIQNQTLLQFRQKDILPNLKWLICWHCGFQSSEENVF